jgi:RNA polymerase sigma-70 factor (ECF subfamily)
MQPPPPSPGPQALPAPAASSADPAPGEDGFGSQIQQLTPQLRAFLGRLLRGGATYGSSLDDLVQETLTRSWRSRASFDAHRGSLASWLLRIAFTVYLDHRAAPPPESSVRETATQATDPVAAAAAREHLLRLLAQLDPRERHLLLRFHRDGRSIAELAHETGLAAGTVKSLLHRARARLWAFERRQEPS